MVSITAKNSLRRKKATLLMLLCVIAGFITCDDNPESEIVECMPVAIAGTLTNAYSIRYVECRLSGDHISGSKHYDMVYDQPNKAYGGTIDVPIEGNEWELTVMAINGDNNITGYKIVTIGNDLSVIVIPEFDARNAIPTITATGSVQASYNDTVTLTCSAYDNFGGMVSISCDIGNTGTFVSFPSGRVTIITTQDMASPYEIAWRATDNDGNTVSKTSYLYIRLFAPVASAGNDTAVSKKDTVVLNGVGIDTVGTIMEYAWKIGVGNAFIAVSQGDTVYPSPDQYGTYVNILRVTDDDGLTDFDTMVVTVKAMPPIVTATTSDTLVHKNDTIHLSGTAVDDGTIVQYAWKFGSNDYVITSGTDTVIQAPDTANDTYVCSLRVTDDEGEAGYDAVTIRVVEGWLLVTEDGGYPPRDKNTHLAFDNRMWIIGGLKSAVTKNDVWYSYDGITWTQATDSAAFSKRFGHTSIVFNNKMWVIGGKEKINISTNKSLNDVWYSVDGVTWTLATANASFPDRYNHASVVFNNKMWIIGGGKIRADGNNYDPTKDVWSSSDGVTWEQSQITMNGALFFEYGHSAEAFNNKIFVYGGYLKQATNGFVKHAWHSSDGSDWYLVEDAIPEYYWHPRSTVCDNRVFLANGTTLLSSTDGLAWTYITEETPFNGGTDTTARIDFSLITSKDKLWIFTGYYHNSQYLYATDVWCWRGDWFLKE